MDGVSSISPRDCRGVWRGWGAPVPGLTPTPLQPASCYHDNVSPSLCAAPTQPELMEPQRNETKATECQ